MFNDDNENDNENENINLKIMRLLTIFKWLNEGERINTQELATSFEVHPRTIQRYIRDLRVYLADPYLEESSQKIIYDAKSKTYTLQGANMNTWLTNQEIVAISKVILESRAFCRKELEDLLNKLTLQSIPEQRNFIKDILINERFHYVDLQHKQPLVENIWDLSQAVREQQVVELLYLKTDAEIPVKRLVEPQGILFSEYYFYLIAYVQGAEHDFPRIFRLDRIKECNVLQQKFKVQYSQRFEEGEFRKRVQFMLPGQLIKIQFRYWGNSLEAVLDRFPNAKILSENKKEAVIEAEIFGLGVKMWLLSQGQNLEVLRPEKFRKEMKDTITEMMKIYT